MVYALMRAKVLDVGDNRSALRAIRETMGIIELLAKIAVDLADRAEKSSSGGGPMTESLAVIAGMTTEQLMVFAFGQSAGADPEATPDPDGATTSR